ncbi:MAG: YceI family protein [Cytophagaceae bacterium]|nr:YceI family protein [Cytophagaceae bacterium]MBK9508172.1 YceI family protein [Cytophagaceae bacterium]MBK9936567.1 YceI family protein [Cytophagaceae bacterium]MBL0300322.1 YceI family protein [Cytophagaceae bacterium]MBL0327254.1 YceI family protein [Cytophagaceae bacterium]
MKLKLITLVLLSSFVLGNVAFAQTKLSAKSAKISLSGNSTMHKWSSNVTKVAFSGDFGLNDGNLTKINSAVVKIETKSIKSHNDSDLMDERTHKTLKAEQFPNISYEYTNTLSSDLNGKEGTIKVNGKLTIAGVTKPTDLVLKVTTLANGDIQVKGSEVILMTNFGIKPPSFVAGTLKVEDKVNIAFDVVLKK